MQALPGKIRFNIRIRLLEKLRELFPGRVVWEGILMQQTKIVLMTD